MKTNPAYLALAAAGELSKRAALAREHLQACDLCARNCSVDRNTTPGACRTGINARVASYGAHHGEEDPLRGIRGSGTIFFAWCNLRCVYCQNADISQTESGREVHADELAAIMLALQAQGCHNINLVSPSHVVAPILEALELAAENGLTLPLVYNTGGYDSLAALSLLEDVIDIYMPDMKYSNAATGTRLSSVEQYPRVNRAAVKEMHRQVGDLILDADGLAERGLLVRHLVLPGGLSGTGHIVNFLAEEISTNTYINIMDQYHPAHQAHRYPPLNRRLKSGEYLAALAAAKKAGLNRLDSRYQHMPR
ncbi:MAG: radical SAM protein [Anaerolineales bacterium]|nr:radical SAM protein [Anaerolineales bacterium]